MLVGDSETGKSTAARCALSVCGQHNVGHLMKTKSTSDTLCLERCTASTMPFVLDDPKSAEGVGELLIDLCNGRLTGNMKVGLRKPRSILLMCCNFTIYIGTYVFLSSICSRLSVPTYRVNELVINHILPIHCLHSFCLGTVPGHSLYHSSYQQLGQPWRGNPGNSAR